MRKLLRYGLATIVAGATVLASVVIASPAQAYDNSKLSATEIRVNTTNCPCSYPDPADGTYFKKDSGGIALKWEFRYPGRGMVAKTEWHPYGEYLWVYDTANDSDTIYVVLVNLTTGASYGPYKPPGTSKLVEYTKVNLSFAEGDYIGLDFYDGPNRTDYLGSSSLGRA